MGANEKHGAAYHGGEYTPSLSAVSNDYSNGNAYRITHQGAVAEFDRFIAKVRFDAYNEGAEATHISGDFFDVAEAQTNNPYK